MINRSAKGKRNEKKTEEYFQKDGFLVESVKSTKAFTKVDLFGLWDHIAVATEHASYEVESIDSKKNTMPMAFTPGDILFIQTKTNRKESRKAMSEHLLFPASAHHLLVVWIDRVKEPRLISLNS